MDNKQLVQLHRALLDAFPNKQALARMTRFGLERELDRLTQAGTLEDAAFDLIQWAQAHGRIYPLIAAAQAANPENPALQRWADSLGVGAYPFVEYRVAAASPPAGDPDRQGGRHLLALQDGTRNPGALVDRAWHFTATDAGLVVRGPYLRTLPPGAYAAIFRLQVADLPRENRPLVLLDVVSAAHRPGDKLLAARTLTPADFHQAREDQEFPLDFRLFADEQALEFRLASCGGGDRLALAWVRLARGAM